MKKNRINALKYSFWFYILIAPTTTLFAQPAANDITTVGSYCPGTSLMLVIAEELTVSLDAGLRSKASYINGHTEQAIRELASTGTTLELASSRGAAARTNLLIDAIINANADENYTQLLKWFPLLRSSMQTLPDDPAVMAANNLIDQSEKLMQLKQEGNPIKLLKDARHQLSCNKIDVPIQAALATLDQLTQQVVLSAKPASFINQLDRSKNKINYDPFIQSITKALKFTLVRGKY